MNHEMDLIRLRHFVESAWADSIIERLQAEVQQIQSEIICEAINVCVGESAIAIDYRDTFRVLAEYILEFFG